VYRLAESYRLYRDFGNAEKWYAESTKFDALKFPLSRYWYAICLRANGRYADAEKQFNNYLQSSQANVQYRQSALREIENCQFIRKTFEDSAYSRIHVLKAGGGVNGGGANYAPAWRDNFSLVFTSSRSESEVAKKGKNPFINALYRASVTDSGFANVSRLDVKQEKLIQQGAAAFSNNGTRMYFTQWVKENDKNLSSLYRSDWQGQSWSEPVKLGNGINTEGYSSMQPFITTDGKYLIYASDRPGGVGKFDLWYSMVDASGNPGAPVNCGTVINTEEDEQAPFYHEHGKQLVFASNGRVGMGGFDLFIAKGNFNDWEKPSNPGYPVNSVKDDLYFSSTDTTSVLNNAWFSSDRKSVCCLEIYHLTKSAVKVTGRVVDCSNGEPLIDARVNVVDTISNRLILTQTIPATGAYLFDMDDYQPLKLTVQKQGYNTKSMSFYKPEGPVTDTLQNPQLCLSPLPPPDTAKPFAVNEAILLKDIYYDFDKATLRPESFPVLDSLANIMKRFPGMTIELGAHTDSKGSDEYNLKLSAGRAKSCVEYLAGKNIETSRLLSKGFGECCPVAPNTINGKDNPDGRQLNRRTVFKVLHY